MRNVVLAFSFASKRVGCSVIKRTVRNGLGVPTGGLDIADFCFVY